MSSSRLLPLVESEAADDAPARRLRDDLASRARGEVRFDPGSRATYSTDASNYRQVPIGVVVPASVDDAVVALEVCREHDVPVLSRGGGTSLAGECCNTAVVLDWSKYCTGLVSVDTERRTATVEPGIKLDDLDNQLREHGLVVGPKPSTHPSCTIGGMIGNNSCGATAQEYGKMVDSVLRLEILTYDGVRTWVGPTTDEEFENVLSEGGRKAEIYRELREIRDRHLAEIRTDFPDIPRRVSGYNLDSLLPERHFDLARALVGSESTLVTVLRAELRLFTRPTERVLVVLGYRDVFAAADAVPAVNAHQPFALEGIDQRLVHLEHAQNLARNAIDQLPEGGGWLLVEFAGTDADTVQRRAQALIDELTGDDSPSVTCLTDPAHEDELWKARESGLGATAFPPHAEATHEGWEDAAVPPDELGRYLRDFEALLTRFDYGNTSLYGHFGHGCVHTRIPFDLSSAAGIAAYREFAERSADLVVSYGGSLSGEHGDGQARGELLVRMFGADLIAAFEQVKAVFDPQNRMNPGKVVHPNPLDSQLRKGVDYRPAEPGTHFAYPHDNHRFSKAAARCVGFGKCRGLEGGVMCPSYRATGEEEHSTRGRARLLFEMLNGEVITDGWRSTEVRDALDLCLACKGCKSDCPVDVDMATYKAEFLAHHYDRRLRPMAHYSMGWLPLWAAAASSAPRAVNALAHAPGVADVVKRAGGIAPQREIPRFARQRFTGWFGSRQRRNPGNGDPVVLWPDTFTNSFHPHVARAAVEVLEDAGFTVTVPQRPSCCGLTWISTGQLKTATRVLRRTLRTLRPALRAGAPVVVLEPSCAAVFRSDMPELLHGDEDARRLANQTRTLAELLRERAPDWRTPPVDEQAIVQPHCHQHAVLGTGADSALMSECGIDAHQLDAGCCGLAGNFGFEAGHYEVSMACAEDKLLPAVRAAETSTLVLADGFSCRTQIEHGNTGRRPVHLAEVLADAMRGAR